MAIKQKTVSITEGVIWKQLLLFAVPILISNFLQQMYNAADLIIVGRFTGSEALAAVGSTTSLINLMIGFLVGLSVGAGVVISQFYGANAQDDVSKSVHSAIALSLSMGVLFTVIGVFFIPSLLKVMQTPEDVIDQASAYLRIFFTGMIPTIIYNMGTGVLRAIGDTRRPLYYLAVCTSLNVLLDLLFVAVFHWGVAGAAWATVLSQYLSAGLVLWNLTNTEGCYRLFWRQIRFHWETLGRIVRVGLPAGAQSVVISLSNVIIQSQINLFGSMAVGGFAAAMKIDGFLFTILNAFALSTATFVGQNIGAGRYDRVKKSVHASMFMSLLLIIPLSAVLLLWGRQVLSLFNEDPQVIEYGFKLMRLVACAYWLFTIGEILSGAVKGAGSATVPMIISTICMCAVRIIWIIVMFSVVGRNLMVLYLCYPVAWVLNMACITIYYFRGNWMYKFEKMRKKAAEVGGN